MRRMALMISALFLLLTMGGVWFYLSWKNQGESLHKEKIIGEWELVKVDIRERGSYIEFTKNGEVSITVYFDGVPVMRVNGTYTLSGDDLTMVVLTGNTWQRLTARITRMTDREFVLDDDEEFRKR